MLWLPFDLLGKNQWRSLLSQSIQTRTSLKGQFLGVFRLIVAHRRNEFTSILTKSERKIHIPKSDLGLNALALRQ